MGRIVVPRSAAELEVLLLSPGDASQRAARLARIQSVPGRPGLPPPSWAVVRAWEFYLGVNGASPLVVSAVLPLAWAAAEAAGHAGSGSPLPIPYSRRAVRKALPSFIGGARPTFVRLRGRQLQPA